MIDEELKRRTEHHIKAVRAACIAWHGSEGVFNTLSESEQLSEMSRMSDAILAFECAREDETE